MNPEPILEFLHAHRSIRRYTDEPVPDADIRTAVAAGQAASTSSAIQAYSVLHITRPEIRQQLAELTGPQEKVARAGAFLVICGDTRRHRLACTSAGTDYDARLEAFLLAVVDASLFAQNMALAFEAMGYGICYIGGLRNHIDAVDELIRTPEGVYPLYGMCVGRPAEAPGPRPRLPVDQVLHKDDWPDDNELMSGLDDYDATYRDYLEQRGASPRGWTEAMVRLFDHPARTQLAPHYTSKGANLT